MGILHCVQNDVAWVRIFVMDYKIAGSWQRLAAGYLSLFIYLLLAFAIYSIFDLKEIKVFVILAFVFSMLDTLVMAYTGYNLAGLLLGIKQVTAYEHKPLLLQRSLLHYLFSLFSLLILGLGYLAGFFNQGKRNLQDIVSDSQAIEAPLIPYITKPLLATFSLIGCLLTIVVPAALALMLVLILKSSLLSATSPYYSSPLWEMNPVRIVSVDLANNQVIALTRLHPDDINYVPYLLDPTKLETSISVKQLDELDLNVFDYIYQLRNLPKDIAAASIEDLVNIKLEKYVLAPELIVQDSQGGDIVIHDLLMKVEEKSVLGRDVLDIFDYTIKESKLDLILHGTDSELFSDSEMEPAYREALLRNLALLHHKWQQELKIMPASLVEQLTLHPQELNNSVELNVEASSGFITAMLMTEPSKSNTYNEFCKRFISSIKRLKPIPAKLLDRYSGSYTLKVDLRQAVQSL